MNRNLLVESKLREVNPRVVLNWINDPFKSSAGFDPITDKPMLANLPIPTNHARLAVAFHEIGHIATVRHGYSEQEKEILAWQWAKQNLPYWNKEMWLMAVVGLKSHGLTAGQLAHYSEKLAGIWWNEWKQSSMIDAQVALLAA